MALGTMTIVRKVKVGPLHADRVSFAGDGAYPAGGSLDFEGLYQAALKAAGLGSPGREIISVTQDDVSGYVLRYDKTNDKLMVFESNSDAADGPLQQSSTANLSGTTFAVTILSM